MPVQTQGRAKVLNPQREATLRRNLRQEIVVEPDPDEGAPYPRMLYRPGYLMNQITMKRTTDPHEQRRCEQAMPQLSVIVDNAEDEAEYLEDGYTASPADQQADLDAMGIKDPRIPVGREFNRAQAQLRLSKEDEIAMLTRRFRELTAGKNIHDFLKADPELPPPAVMPIGDVTHGQRVPTAATPKKATPKKK